VENQKVVRFLINDGFLSLNKNQLRSQTSATKTTDVVKDEEGKTDE
jgi:hypothetical protein